jgi:ribosomal protein L21
VEDAEMEKRSILRGDVLKRLVNKSREKKVKMTNYRKRRRARRKITASS